MGSVQVDTALPVQELADEDALVAARVGPNEALGHLPSIPVDPEVAARIRNGQRVRIEAPGGTSEALVTVTCGTDLLAMAALDDGVLRPRKVFSA